MSGISMVEVFWDSKPVGRLALTPQGLCAFEYDAEFLRNGTSISPFFLPLESKLFVAERDPFDGGFGVFSDSLPDGWGSLLLDRYLREQGRDPDKLTILDRLSLIGSKGRGALEYKPDESVEANSDFADFDKLANESERLLANEHVEGEPLDELYKYGGSSGGARPKVFVKIGEDEWLVKFKASMDPCNVGQTEYNYSILAKECGIDMLETKLFDGKYFGVKRFDRNSRGKIHTISAAGLLNASYRTPSLDYADLLKVCHVLTSDMEQVYLLFRQAVFNAIISNRDDHAKNFSFQYIEGKWKLSPAYDILPSSGFNGYHTTTYNGKGNPSINDIMEIALKIGLTKKRAKEIIGEISEKCKRADMLKVDLLK